VYPIGFTCVCCCAAVGGQDADRQVQQVWILLELCDRGSLQDAIDRGAFRAVRMGRAGSQADMPAVVTTALEVASAMAYLHSVDILHGDLTAGNILLVSDHEDPRGFAAKARSRLQYVFLGAFLHVDLGSRF
jgi:serine/threonine protein kinase